MAGSVVRAMKSQLQGEGGSTNVGRQISESKISFIVLHNDEQSQKELPIPDNPINPLCWLLLHQSWYLQDISQISDQIQAM
jgi:hypothetical protein